MSWFSLRRLRALLSKEIIQMRRDRVTFAMMLGVPLMQLLLFGYAINNDPKHLPAALVAPTQDRFTRAMVSALELTGYYNFTHPFASAAEAEGLIARGAVSFVVTIPSDFGQRVERGDNPQILIEADATDPAVASGAISTLGSVATGALSREIGHEGAPAPVDIVVHRRYNPEGLTQYNIVPGLMGVILQMIMVMMTSMALTRENERGTMENLLAMPVRPFEVMAGKVVPYIAIGLLQVTLILLVAVFVFRVPFVGSLSSLYLASLLFVAANLTVGIMLSSLAKNQLQAMQMTVFYFMPNLLLSGFMFPFQGMPGWAQCLGNLLPLTYFNRLVRAIFLKGTPGWDLWPNVWPLMLFTAVVMAIAVKFYRKTLD